MPNVPGEHYLTDQVMTASTQRLQLMIIDGAVRHAQRAIAMWSEDDWNDTCEAILKAQDLVTEAMSGLQVQDEDAKTSELSRKLAGIYVFIFRRLVESHVRKDKPALEEAIRVLEEERETWRQICEKFGSSKTDTSKMDSVARIDSSEEAKPKRSAKSNNVPAPSVDMDAMPSEGFSFEA